MKRFAILLAVAAVCSAFVYSCKEEPQVPDEPQNQSADPSEGPSQEPSADVPVSADPSVEPTVLNILSEELLEFGPEGGEAAISFESNKEVSAEASAVWIEVGSVGEGQVQIRIQENESWGREGTVTLKAGFITRKVTVKQAKTDQYAKADAGLAEETFTEKSGDVVNPERGFYVPFELSADYNSISASRIKSLRAEGHTVMYVQYCLPRYMDKDIPAGHLENIQKDMDALREGGAKCVLRFCYKVNEKESNKPWDPEEKWVMRHIEQVKPILQKNEDVIMLFQAGYVGVWGEWYYTDHFGMNPSSFEAYAPRRRVLEAMLEALPASRQVAVRTPDFKMGMYGIGLKDTLNAATAHDGSILSRIGGYNDCFGAASDDLGTYGKGHSRSFWKGDTRYTFMGGETCGVSDYCKCPVTLKDMAAYHWTYLNIDYNKSVHKVWKNGGCWDEITRRLGYRIVMEKVLHTPTPVAGEPYRVVLYFRNDGFAAFQNPRDARLVFVASDGAETEFALGDCVAAAAGAPAAGAGVAAGAPAAGGGGAAGVAGAAGAPAAGGAVVAAGVPAAAVAAGVTTADPRTWHSGPHRLEAVFDLPAATGTLYLVLSDPLLRDRPEYSVALANTDVWDPATGRNKLLEIK